MATQFQNRLIGTVILVSLGVIFLPDLLSGKRSNHHEPIASIPLRPEAAAPLPVVSAAATPQGGGSGSVAEGVVVTNNAAVADEQWSVAEVAPTVTTGPAPAGEVVAAAAGSVVAADATAAKPVVVANNPVATKPVVTPSAQTAEKPVAKSEVSKPVEVKPVAVKPVQPTLQAGQVKPFAEVAGVQATSTAGKVQPVTQPKPSTPSKPTTTSGTAWVIQAGVFSSSVNANALVGKLRAGGLPANVSSFRSGGTLLYRVSVGPNVSRAKLDSLVPRVSQIAGTTAKVVAYSPLG